jgi:hypothetical protein
MYKIIQHFTSSGDWNPVQNKKAALIYGCNKRRVPETKGCNIIHILFVAVTAFADKSSTNQAYRFVN